MKIEGADHEFATVEGVVEDVTDIVLNLKKVRFRHNNREPQEVRLNVTADGPIVAGDLELPPGLKVVNKKQVCLLYTSPSPRDKRQSRMPSSA